MNTKEAKELMLKYLMPRIEQYGFRKPGRGSEFQIKRKTKNGEDVINGGINDYNPVQQILFGVLKKDTRVTDILLMVQSKGIKLSPMVDKNTFLLGYSYDGIHNPSQIGYLPLMEIEADVEKCVNLMVDFLERKALPLLDKFEDLREIDKMINGIEPWEADFDKPYSFGTYFNFSRLIIAKLCDNEKYEELIDFTYSTLERRSKENGYNYVYDRHDLNKPLPALIQLLNEVRPIY